MAAAAGILIIVFLASFLLGSIPWGVIVSKLAFGKDIRSEGSGNIGTTNAMRTLGKKGGAAVFVLDFGKGVLATWLALFLAVPFLMAPDPATQLPVALPLLQALSLADVDAAAMAELYVRQLVLACSFLGCVCGHIYSPWLGFKGGKGIAVAVGSLVWVFGWAGTLFELVLFVALVVITRYVSVGSLAAAVACPFVAWVYYGNDPLAWALIAIAAVLVVFAHRANIKRLATHSENRIGAKRAASDVQPEPADNAGK